VKAFLDAYYRGLRVAVTLLMGLLLLPVTLQIVSRYTALIPRWIWTEEVARFCFIWIIMLGAMIAVRDGTHFDVDVLPPARTRHGQAVGRLAVYALMGLLSVIFVRYGYDFALFGWQQNSELTGLNMIYIFLAWPLAGLTWLLFLGERVVEAVRALGDRSPAPRTAPSAPDAPQPLP
jgi:TRAP-type transport system small permease protein